MARYRAYKSDLALVTQGGKIKYQFRNYILDGVTITPDLAGTDLNSVMQVLYPTGGTDLAKVGLDQIFIAATKVIAAGTLLTATKYYEVVAGSGAIDLTGANYVGKYTMILPVNAHNLANVGPGCVIRVDSAITVPAGDDVWAPTFAPGLKLDEIDDDFRGELFKHLNLTTHKDESSWDSVLWGAVTKAPGYTRE